MLLDLTMDPLRITRVSMIWVLKWLAIVCWSCLYGVAMLKLAGVMSAGAIDHGMLNAIAGGGVMFVLAYFYVISQDARSLYHWLINALVAWVALISGMFFAAVFIHIFFSARIVAEAEYSALGTILSLVLVYKGWEDMRADKKASDAREMRASEEVLS